MDDHSGLAPCSAAAQPWHSHTRARVVATVRHWRLVTQDDLWLPAPGLPPSSQRIDCLLSRVLAANQSSRSGYLQALWPLRFRPDSGVRVGWAGPLLRRHRHRPAGEHPDRKALVREPPALADYSSSGHANDVAPLRHEQRRRLRARGRRFPRRASSRAASRLAIRPRADRASEERRGGKPRSTALLIAERGAPSLCAGSGEYLCSAATSRRRRPVRPAQLARQELGTGDRDGG